MKAYICGPMRHIACFNFPAFFEAEDFLAKAGLEVYNPARVGGLDTTGMTGFETQIAGFDIRETMAVEMDWLCRHADVIVTLPGSDRSPGARAEMAAGQAVGALVARYDLLKIVLPTSGDVQQSVRSVAVFSR